MANRTSLKEIPLSSRYSRNNRGIDDAITGWNKNNFTDSFSIVDLYQFAGNGFFASGEFMFADPSKGQLFFADNGAVKLVAGWYGVIAHKDGPGPIARLAIGGLQGAYQIARDPAGNYFFPQAKFNCISKATKQPDNSWVISTFYTGIGSNSIAIDPVGNIYASSGSLLIRIGPNGVVNKQWNLPFSNVLQLEYRTAGLFMITRQNAWDVIMKLDIASEQVTRITGMTQSEIDAWCAANGVSWIDYGNANHDGGPGEASIHSAGMCYVADDGSEIHFVGGDQPYFRRWLASTNHVDTLMVNATWREQSIRVGGPHPNTDPNLPFYSFQGGARQANGLPAISAPVNHVPELWRTRWFSELQIIQVPDPPGGTVEGTLDGINQLHEAFGWARDQNNPTAHQTVTIKIDGIDAGTIVANTPSGDVGDHRFFWPIPTQFKNGLDHSLAAFVGAFQLWASPKTFNIQAQEEETMNANLSWSTKTIQNVPNPETFTKWRITIQAPGIPIVFTGNTQTTVTIPLPADLAPGSYPVLVERVNTAVTVVAGSATGTMVIPNTGGPVLVPDVVTIVLQ